MTKIITSFLLLLLLFSCSPKLIETNLYFGQSKPGGGNITEKEWNAFKEKYISKVFKEGSSVFSVSGNWYDTTTHRLITEQTYMVSYLYKSSAAVSKQIDSLRIYYRQLFNQESVLRVDKKVSASF